MAKIFKPTDDSRVPDLSTIKSVLDIPEMEFKSIDNALDSFTTFESTDINNAEENFSKLVEHRDKVTNETFGNLGEKERFENARKDIGLSNDAFKMSMDDLKDPYKIRGVSSRLGQLYERNDVKQVLFDQANADEYLKKIVTYKDQNPSLYNMALAKYNDYRNNKITGRELLAQEFEPVDIDAVMKTAADMIPKTITSELIDENGVVSVEKVSARNKESVRKMLDEISKNSKMYNNLKAKYGSDENIEAYLKQVVEAQTRGDLEIAFKLRSVRSGKTKPSIKEMIIASGGDPTGLTDFEAEAIGKKYQEHEVVGDKVIVTYGTDNNRLTKEFPLVSRGGSDAMTDSGRTSINIFGKEVELTDSIDGGKAIDGPGVSKNTITKVVERDGKKYLITNDSKVKNIIPEDKKLEEIGGQDILDGDWGIDFSIFDSKENVDADELNRTIGAGLDEDNKKGFVVTEYVPPKTSVDFLDVTEEDKLEIEKQLDRNPFIKENYAKGSEKYKYAAKFLSDLDLQNGYYYDVYVPEELDKGVAALPNTKTRRELSPNQRRYLVHHQGRDGAKYYVENDGKISPETIKKANKTNRKDADGKTIYLKKGDKGFRDVPKELRDALAKIGPGEENFEKFKEVVESGGKHILSTPLKNSSALGVHQVLFDTHYKKIKEYIDNYDNKLYEHNKTVETDTTKRTKENFYTTKPENKNH